MVSPLNKIIVQITSKYQDEIITQSGVKLYKDTTFNSEWHTTITGKVVSIPHKVTSGNFEAGNLAPSRGLIEPEVQPGDELVFSYLVVQDRDFPKDPDQFFIHDDNQYSKEWKNCLGDKLAYTQIGPKQAVGYLSDKYGEWLDGRQGTPREIEKWLTGFKFGDASHMVYANCIWEGDQDYWLVDYLWAFAYKRNDELRMVGGYVLLEATEIDRGETYGQSTLIIPEHLRKIKKKGEAKIAAVGAPLKGKPNLNLKPGDTVLYPERFAQKYELYGKHYLIIEQARLLAKCK